MTMRQPTPVDAALVAIDIAQARNEVLIEVPGQRRRRRLTVPNTRAEHDRLVEALRQLGRPGIAGFEATGNYHRAIAWRLLSAGFEVRLVSSLALARTREALHNSWDKNDPKDAQVILHLLRIGATQRYHDPLASGTNDLQELSKTHEAVSKAKTELLHRIQTHYLPLYFPEFGRFRSNGRSDWFFAFLERFPVPASITVMDREAFITAAWEVAGRKVAKARLLADIHETARTSIALPVPPDAPAVAMFRLVLAQARTLIAQRDAIEAQADALLRDHPDYRRLCTIPGIGPINALTILAEAGDLRRFGHHRQFLKFCGLDLATRQSGQFRGQTKLSKFGNARLRRALWMAGQVAIRQPNNSFRDKLQRYTARDRDNPDLRRKAFTAITAKMARVATPSSSAVPTTAPSSRRGGAKWANLSRHEPSRRARDLVDNVRVFHLDRYLVFRTVRATAARRWTLGSLWLGAASVRGGSHLARLTMTTAPAQTGARRSLVPAPGPVPDIGRCPSGCAPARPSRPTARRARPGRPRR
jgi:transposase